MQFADLTRLNDYASRQACIMTSANGVIYLHDLVQGDDAPCHICGRSYAHEHISRVGRQDSFSSTDDS